MGHGHSRVLEPALSFSPPQQLLSHFKLCGEGEQPSLPSVGYPAATAQTAAIVIPGKRLGSIPFHFFPA